MKKVFNFIWLGMVFCQLFQSGISAAQVQVRLAPTAPGEVRITFQFAQPPDFYYYLRPEPLALILVLAGGLEEETIRPAANEHVNAIQLKSISADESRIIISLKTQASIRVDSDDRLIEVFLSAPVQRTSLPKDIGDKKPDFEPRLAPDLAKIDLTKLRIRRIVIDPGHGGWDSGAAYGSAIEKDIVLDIALKLEQLLSAHADLQVYLTRRGDYYLNLRERTLIANQFHADLFISIHANAAKNRTRQGVETYYCSETASDNMAAMVAEMENAVARQEEEKILPQNYVDIEEILFTTERKIYWEDSRKIGALFQRNLAKKFAGSATAVKGANFSVLRNAKMPAILVEVGYISNFSDRKQLLDGQYRWKIAEELFQIIRGIR